MLFSLFSSLVEIFSFLNVFKYLTVRTGLSMFTSMTVVFLVGGPLINYFSSHQIHDPIREDGPSEHIVKKIGTPTMGGLMILLGIFSGVLLWGDLSNNARILFLRSWIVIARTRSMLLFKLAEERRPHVSCKRIDAFAYRSHRN